MTLSYNIRPLMQRVHDTEFDAAIDWLWDDDRLDDDWFDDEARVATWREVEGWLRGRVIERFPAGVSAHEER
jgi:hypothetical protein